MTGVQVKQKTKPKKRYSSESFAMTEPLCKSRIYRIKEVTIFEGRNSERFVAWCRTKEHARLIEWIFNMNSGAPEFFGWLIFGKSNTLWDVKTWKNKYEAKHGK
jgi:hypothetical protein